MSDSMNVTPLDANAMYPTVTSLNTQPMVVALPTQRDGQLIISFPPWLLLVAGLLIGAVVAIYLMNSSSRCRKDD